MFCKNCGKEINDRAAFCAYCGVPTSHDESSQQTEATNVLAIIGFIFSFFIPIVGIVCSIIGYNETIKHNESGRGLALAGIVISAIFMAIGVIAIVIAAVMSA